MACNTNFLHDQSDKTLNVIVSQKSSLDMAFEKVQTFSLFSRIILLLKQLLAMNLLVLLDGLIK